MTTETKFDELFADNTDDEDEEETNETLDVDLQLAKDALVGAWEEADGKSHVLVYHHDDDGEIEEHYVTYEVRDHSRGDCIHATNVFEWADVVAGEVVDHSKPETLAIGSETFDVRWW